jgi:hypothetical protein
VPSRCAAPRQAPAADSRARPHRSATRSAVGCNRERPAADQQHGAVAGSVASGRFPDPRQPNCWRLMSNGWTAERRKQQAEAIRRWKPWESSTGPRSDAGKRRSAMNGYRDGERQAWPAFCRDVLGALRAHDRAMRALGRLAARRPAALGPPRSRLSRTMNNARRRSPYRS